MFAAFVLSATFARLAGLSLPMGWVGLFATSAIGLFTYRLTTESQSRTTIWYIAVLTILIAAGLCVGFWDKHLTSPGSPTLFTVLISWGFGYAIFFLSFRVTLPALLTSGLVWLGAISYSVYLCQNFSFQLLNANDIHGWLYLPLTTVITLVISMMTYRFIEKPAINLGHRWKAKKATAHAKMDAQPSA